MADKKENLKGDKKICHTGEHLLKKDSSKTLLKDDDNSSDSNMCLENTSNVSNTDYEFVKSTPKDNHIHLDVDNIQNIDKNHKNSTKNNSSDNYSRCEENNNFRKEYSHSNNHNHSHKHNHSNNHNHSHSLKGHDHSHENMDFIKQKENKYRLILVLLLTLGVGVAEIAVSIYSGSLALLADSGHMFADSLGLIFALFIVYIMSKPSDEKHTWGYKRAEVLGALGQSIILSAVSIYIVISAINRLFYPNDIDSSSMGIMGIIGLIANGISIILLLSSRKENMNMRAAFLEVLADTLGSVGVVVAAILISLTGFTFFDIVVSSIIAIFIITRAISMGNKATNILLEAVPDGIDLKAINEHISSIKHVIEMHDIHVSMISTNLYVLSAHVVVEEGCFSDNHSRIILDQVQHCLANHFNVPIKHVTIQLESPHHIKHEYNPCNS